MSHRKFLIRESGPRRGSRYVLGCLVAFATLATFPLCAIAQEYNGQFPNRPTQSVDRLIIKWKADAQNLSREQKHSRLAKQVRAKVTDAQSLAPRMEVLRLDRRVTAAELSATIASVVFCAAPLYVFPTPT